MNALRASILLYRYGPFYIANRFFLMVNSRLLSLIALLSRTSGPSIPLALIVGLSLPLVPPLTAPAMFLAPLIWCIWHAK